MAKLVEVTEVCDYCYSGEDHQRIPPVDTIQMTFDRTAYELDVCAEHLAEFNEMRSFITEHGRPLKKASPKNSQPARPADSLLCPDCGRPFANGTGLAVHRQSAHEEVESRDCPECGQVCKGLRGLKTHMRITHDPTGETSCPECGQACNGSQGLAIHRKSAHSDPGLLAV